MSNIYDMVDTWNDGGTTFTAIKMNVTDMASQAASLLIDLQVGAVSKFNVGKNGDASLASAAFLAWSTDLKLFRDAANILAQRNGVNAQAFRVYNTFTDASNGEWLSIEWLSNVAALRPRKAGTGVLRDLILDTGAILYFQTASVTRLYINSSGHLLAFLDNTYDIGASGANRPRTIYAGTDLIAGGKVQSSGDVVAGATGDIQFTSRGRFRASADGVILIANTAVNDFGRLQFGGTTSSFPALKRSSTVLQARLADDSGFAPLQGALRTQANAVAETPTATHTMIITDAGGTAYRVLCVV